MHPDRKFARSALVAIVALAAVPILAGGCSSPCTGLTRWESPRDVAFVAQVMGADFCGGVRATEAHIAGIPDAIGQSFRDGAHRISGTQALYGGCYSQFQAGVGTPGDE